MRSSAEHSIMQELAAVELLGFAGPGLGAAALEGWNPNRFGSGSARRGTEELWFRRRTPAASPSRRHPGRCGRPAESRDSGDHDILPWPRNAPGAPRCTCRHQRQLGRVGMGQRRSDRRAVPSRYAGRRRCNSRRVLLGTLPQPVLRQPDVTRLPGSDLPALRMAPRGPEVRLGKRGADLPEGRAASEEYERRPGTSKIRQMMRPDRFTTLRRAVANWTNQTRQLVKAIRPWAAAVRALPFRRLPPR